MGVSANRKRLPITPFWKGPVVDGVTQSMLSNFIVCPERFYVKTVLGLKPETGMSRALTYGTMWHVCEEYHSRGEDWEKPLKRCAVGIGNKYPTDRVEIEKWYNICRVTFPIYVDYWGEHEEKGKNNLLAEYKFKIPYQLPTGRNILLRGMMDSVDALPQGIVLQENKTNAEIKEDQLLEELPNTLQPMFYLSALEHLLESNSLGCDLPLKGIRWNCARRPLGGGKHSIRQHRGRQLKSGKTKGAETKKMFYERLGRRIAEDPGHFFQRFDCTINKKDLQRFQDEILLPILENLLDWWEWVEFCCAEGTNRFDSALRQDKFPQHIPRVFRMPYGIYNVLTEGKQDSYNHFITEGSTSGMQRLTTLFPELEEEF